MLVLILDGAVPSYESCHRVSYISGQNVTCAVALHSAKDNAARHAWKRGAGSACSSRKGSGGAAWERGAGLVPGKDRIADEMCPALRASLVRAKNGTKTYDTSSLTVLYRVFCSKSNGDSKKDLKN